MYDKVAENISINGNYLLDIIKLNEMPSSDEHEVIFDPLLSMTNTKMSDFNGPCLFHDYAAIDTLVNCALNIGSFAEPKPKSLNAFITDYDSAPLIEGELNAPLNCDSSSMATQDLQYEDSIVRYDMNNAAFEDLSVHNKKLDSYLPSISQPTNDIINIDAFVDSASNVTNAPVNTMSSFAQSITNNDNKFNVS